MELLTIKLLDLLIAIIVLTLIPVVWRMFCYVAESLDSYKKEVDKEKERIRR